MVIAFQYNIEGVEHGDAKSDSERVHIVAVPGPEHFRPGHGIADGNIVDIEAAPDEQPAGEGQYRIFTPAGNPAAGFMQEPVQGAFTLFGCPQRQV